MAVQRLTDYTRRIWTALGPDDPTVHDIQVNDIIYYMDASECCVVTHVYPDGSIDNETLPDIGGGDVTYKDITLLPINNTGTGQLNIIYWSEIDDGVPAGNVVALTLNTNHTIHVQVVNGYVQLISQSSTSGWEPYYNDEPLETLLSTTNRALGFKLPPEYTPGEIIKLIH